MSADPVPARPQWEELAAKGGRSVFTEYSPAQVLVGVLRNCCTSAGVSRTSGVPRWSAVRDITGLGSTFAAQLCELAGLDPNEMVRKRR